MFHLVKEMADSNIANIMLSVWVILFFIGLLGCGIIIIIEAVSKAVINMLEWVTYTLSCVAEYMRDKYSQKIKKLVILSKKAICNIFVYTVKSRCISIIISVIIATVLAFAIFITNTDKVKDICIGVCSALALLLVMKHVAKEKFQGKNNN